MRIFSGPILVVFAALIAGHAQADNKPSTRKNAPSRSERSEQMQPGPVAPAAVPLVPKGPNGFGPIKIGMTREALESLTGSDDVYLSKPMNPRGGSGSNSFDIYIATPLSSEPLNGIFTFESDRLTRIQIGFKTATDLLDRVTKQITEKYGAGKVEDGRKEEQCIYQNGANFKITSGKLVTRWVEEISASERIETTVMDLIVDICPPNLRYAMGASKLQNLIIERIQSKAEKPAVSMF